MIIQHNMIAMQASTFLGVNNNGVRKSTEKLSSGYRINRSADDAAGLAISEKMRSQVRGLHRASDNAQDGISLLQTADGALNQDEEIIQRLRVLAVQAANDTNTTEDRQNIQDEVNELVKEIDRIGNQTEFNKKKLLDGTYGTPGNPLVLADNSAQPVFVSSAMIQVGAVADQDVTWVTNVNNAAVADTEKAALEKVLQESIVPNVVNLIMDKFPAIRDVAENGISERIGLKIYRDSSNTLAYVTMAWRTDLTQIQLGLSVNTNTLKYTDSAKTKLTDASRNELESTIAHEMMHAVMDNLMTGGMANYPSGNSFPLWFKEGMAQTMSGGFNASNPWCYQYSNNIDNIAGIQKLINKDNLRTNSDACNYSTGYLATMYLGYLAGGKTMSGDAIRNGVNRIIREIVSNGKSLNTVINEISGGIYSSISDFENKFGPDNASVNFVNDLTKAVGSGHGSLLAGNLSAGGDFVSDAKTSSKYYVPVPGQELVPSTVKPNWEAGGATKTGTGGVAGPDPNNPPIDIPGGGGSGPGDTPGGGSGVGSPNTWIQIGANAGQGISLYIEDCRADALGIVACSMLSAETATNAITTYDDALEKLSRNRSRIGACHNRLEYTVKNNDNAEENLQAAESRIRDVDMASEITINSKYNILMQAGQSMLAQAMNSTQSVLQLLQ